MYVVAYNEEEAAKLRAIQSDPESTNTMRERASMLLGLMDRKSVEAVAKEVGIGETTVRKVMKKYLESGIDGVFPRDGKKPERITFEGKFRTQVGLSSERGVIVGLLMAQYGKMLILRKNTRIPIKDAGGDIVIKGKKPYQQAEKALENGILPFDEALRIIAQSNYSGAFERIDLRQFYSDFLKRTYSALSEYEVVFSGGHVVLNELDKKPSNITFTDRYADGYWYQDVSEIIEQMSSPRQRPDERERILKQFQFFEETHGRDRFPFCWLRDRDEVDRERFLDGKPRNGAMPDGVDTLPAEYLSRLSIAVPHEMQEMDVLAVNAVLIDQYNGHYRTLALQKIFPVHLPVLDKPMLSLDDLEQRMDEMDLLRTDISSGISGICNQLLSDAVLGGMGVSFEDPDPMNEQTMELPFPLDYMRVTKDNVARLLVYDMMIDRVDRVPGKVFLHIFDLPSVESAREDDESFGRYILFLEHPEYFAVPFVKAFYESIKPEPKSKPKKGER